MCDMYFVHVKIKQHVPPRTHYRDWEGALEWREGMGSIRVEGALGVASI